MNVYGIFYNSLSHKMVDMTYCKKENPVCKGGKGGKGAASHLK